MNAARLLKAREKLRDKEKAGLLGVVAASSQMKEGDLFAWLRNPVYAPNKEELPRLESALGITPQQTGDAAADA